jgi:hypothetical protein
LFSFGLELVGISDQPGVSFGPWRGRYGGVAPVVGEDLFNALADTIGLMRPIELGKECSA